MQYRGMYELVDGWGYTENTAGFLNTSTDIFDNNGILVYTEKHLMSREEMLSKKKEIEDKRSSKPNYSIGSGFDKLGRPCKELYFMNLCFEAAIKSLDSRTKCGCIVTDLEGGILTTGYNSPPPNSDDANIPNKAPEKYPFFSHAEANSILSAARNGTALRGSIFYITGFPCIDCLKDILSVKATKIVYGPLQAVMISEKSYLENYKILMKNQKLIVEKFKYLEDLFNINPKVIEVIKDRQDINMEFNVS